MTQASENRRQEELHERRKELSAQDRYRLRVSENEIKSLAKKADVSVEKDQEFRKNHENERLSELAEIDELSRYQMDVGFRKLSQFLDVSGQDFEDNLDTLKYLMSWGQEVSRSQDILKILGAIKSLRKTYGFKEIGTTGLKKLYMYARLDSDERRIQAEKKLLKV